MRVRKQCRRCEVRTRAATRRRERVQCAVAAAAERARRRGSRPFQQAARRAIPTSTLRAGAASSWSCFGGFHRSATPPWRSCVFRRRRPISARAASKFANRAARRLRHAPEPPLHRTRVGHVRAIAAAAVDRGPRRRAAESLWRRRVLRNSRATHGSHELFGERSPCRDVDYYAFCDRHDPLPIFLATDNAATQAAFAARYGARLRAPTPMRPRRSKRHAPGADASGARHTSVADAVADLEACVAKVFKGTELSSFSDAVAHLRRARGIAHGRRASQTSSTGVPDDTDYSVPFVTSKPS